MQAALGFLLILTVHRCYPAGVPRCLQGNFIRRQIRNYPRILCLIWSFAILINLPLFSITKYENNPILVTDSITNTTQLVSSPSCDTEANQIWSRTYLILLLILTFLNSKKYTNKNDKKKQNNGQQYHFLSRNIINQEKSHEASTSSSSATSLNRHQQQNSTSTIPMSLIVPVEKSKCSTNSHSAQHLQVIIMLFIVILLYILLLLPYRLLNLLYIVYNQLFQQNFMNEIKFHWILNTVRLLVFLNCALQPIIYLIISSRLRQTVIKFLQSCHLKCQCQCQCSLKLKAQQHYQNDNQAITQHLSQKRLLKNHPQNLTKKPIIREKHASVNNIHTIGYQPLPLTRLPVVVSHTSKKTPYTVTFTNLLRK
jgi:hypothetical protein